LHYIDRMWPSDLHCSPRRRLKPELSSGNSVQTADNALLPVLRRATLVRVLFPAAVAGGDDAPEVVDLAAASTVCYCVLSTLSVVGHTPSVCHVV